MQNRKVWITLIGLIAVFLFLTYFIDTYNPKEYPHYVSESPSPTGVKALYTYLNDEAEAKRWIHSPERLSNSDENQILLMVEPFFTPEQEEMNAYLDFIEAGNTIVLFKSNPKGMFTINTLPADVEPFDNEAISIRNHNGHEYKAKLEATNRIIPNDSDTVLLEDEAGVIATSRTIGSGELITSLSPEWLMNQNLLDYEHIPLLMSLLDIGPATSYYFDEYIHSPKNASTLTTLYPNWFLLLLLQGAILVVLWLWYKGKRFGPVRIPREETVRFSDEGIRAVSAWYLRGRYYHDSLHIQAEYVKQLLQEKWGIPYHKEWTDLSLTLQQRWTDKKPKEIQHYLRALSNMLKNEKVSEQEYLLWSRNLDELRKEVEKG
ncbi:DUF4350 domain-containing protein [Ferdinandcohnia sp. Marseille-Q9671]